MTEGLVKMKETCTFFITALHAAVSLHYKTPDLNEGDISEDAILKIWALSGGMIFAGELSRKRRILSQKNPLNYYIFSMCLCALINVMVNKSICPAVSYCFILHSFSSVTLSILMDNRCAIMTRVLSSFLFISMWISILIKPVSLEVSSVAFFMEHQSKKFQDNSFEVSHFMGIFLTCSARLMLNSITYLSNFA